MLDDELGFERRIRARCYRNSWLGCLVSLHRRNDICLWLRWFRGGFDVVCFAAFFAPTTTRCRSFFLRTHCLARLEAKFSPFFLNRAIQLDIMRSAALLRRFFHFRDEPVFHLADHNAQRHARSDVGRLCSSTRWRRGTSTENGRFGRQTRDSGARAIRVSTSEALSPSNEEAKANSTKSTRPANE